MTYVVLGSLVFMGCSSAYKVAQTPDDVYYSEGPPRQEVARYDSKQQPDGYASYWERQDDNMLRMKVSDREKWSEVDDIDYWQGYNNNYWVNYNTMYNSPWSWNKYGMGYNPFYYNPYYSSPGWSFGLSSGFGWNSWGFGYNSWNSNWNNPWCWNKPVTVINKFPVGGRSGSSLNGYSNYTYNRSASGLNKSGQGISSGSNRSIWENNSVPSTRNTGNNLFRTITRPGAGYDGGNSSYDRPARTFESGSSSSGSGGSGGSRSSGGSSGTSSRGGRGG